MLCVHLDFPSLFMLHVIWFSEMIAYVNAMFDFIDFHRRVTNSSIKKISESDIIFINYYQASSHLTILPITYVYIMHLVLLW